MEKGPGLPMLWLGNTLTHTLDFFLTWGGPFQVGAAPYISQGRVNGSSLALTGPERVGSIPIPATTRPCAGVRSFG